MTTNDSQLEPAGGAHKPEPDLTDLKQLQAEVAAIKKQKVEENKGFFGWMKRWAGLLAFIGLLSFD